MKAKWMKVSIPMLLGATSAQAQPTVDQAVPGEALQKIAAFSEKNDVRQFAKDVAGRQFCQQGRRRPDEKK